MLLRTHRTCNARPISLWNLRLVKVQVQWVVGVGIWDSEEEDYRRGVVCRQGVYRQGVVYRRGAVYLWWMEVHLLRAHTTRRSLEHASHILFHWYIEQRKSGIFVNITIKKKDRVGKVSHTAYLLSNIVVDQAVCARLAGWEGRFEKRELSKFGVPCAPGKLKLVPISENVGKGFHSDVENGHSQGNNWRKCVGS